MFDNVDFMRDFIKIKPLTDEDCRILVKAFQSGYTEALNPLIKGFSPMIISFIPYQQRTDNFAEDLYQNGVIGLINAAREFDLDSENKFSTYVYVAIRNSAKKMIRKMNIPVYYWSLLKNYEEIIASSDKPLSDEILCEKLSISEKTLFGLKSSLGIYSFTSIDDMNYECRCDTELLDDYVTRMIDWESLWDTVETLSEIEKTVIKKHIGFEYDKTTFEQIGREYGHTRQWAHIIFKQGIEKLKKQQKIKELAKEYL